MMNRQWRLQDAKTHLSQVVEGALHVTPQHITRRGKAAVVVLTENEYAQLLRNARTSAPGLVAHLLAKPQEADAFEHGDVALRDVDSDDFARYRYLVRTAQAYPLHRSRELAESAQR